MNKDLTVIVGTGIGGQREILTALTENGYTAQSAGPRIWPRDHYVYFKGRYVVSGSSRGYYEGNAFGEGGGILIGDDFLLISDTSYVKKHIFGLLSTNPMYQQIKNAIIAEGVVHHPGARIHVAPTGYFHGGKGHDHIDMFSLLLPQRKLLLLDTFFGKGAGRAKEYDAIAEAEGLTLIRYNGFQDRVWYPLNALVLREDDTDVAVVDDQAVSLIKLLTDHCVKVIAVPMPQINFPGGKINCQTNIFNPADNVKLDDLLAKS